MKPQAMDSVSVVVHVECLDRGPMDNMNLGVLPHDLHIMIEECGECRKGNFGGHVAGFGSRT